MKSINTTFSASPRLRVLWLALLLAVTCAPAPLLTCSVSAQDQRQDFRARHDVVIKRAGGVEHPFPCANTDVARGTAFLAAIAAAQDGDVIELGPATFNVGTTQIIPTVAVSVRGSGKSRTTVYSTKSSGGSGGTTWKISDGLEISHLTFTCAPSDGWAYPLGWEYEHEGEIPEPMTVRVHDIVLNGDSDGVYLSTVAGSAVTFEMWDSEINTLYDDVVVNGSNLTAYFKNCWLKNTTPSLTPGAANAHRCVWHNYSDAIFDNCRMESIITDGSYAVCVYSRDGAGDAVPKIKNCSMKAVGGPDPFDLVLSDDSGAAPQIVLQGTNSGSGANGVVTAFIEPSHPSPAAAVLNYGDLPDLIDATKIADGSVTNAEFQRNDATSSIQTQLDAKQAADADLTTYAGITPSANVQTLLGSANFATARDHLDVVPGTDVQTQDTQLNSLAALTSVANLESIANATAVPVWGAYGGNPRWVSISSADLNQSSESGGVTTLYTAGSGKRGIFTGVLRAIGNSSTATLYAGLTVSGTTYRLEPNWTCAATASTTNAAAGATPFICIEDGESISVVQTSAVDGVKVRGAIIEVDAATCLLRSPRAIVAHGSIAENAYTAFATAGASKFWIPVDASGSALGYQSAAQLPPSAYLVNNTDAAWGTAVAIGLNGKTVYTIGTSLAAGASGGARIGSVGLVATDALQYFVFSKGSPSSGNLVAWCNVLELPAP